LNEIAREVVENEFLNQVVYVDIYQWTNAMMDHTDGVHLRDYQSSVRIMQNVIHNEILNRNCGIKGFG
jgi:hypothetical protein